MNEKKNNNDFDKILEDFKLWILEQVTNRTASSIISRIKRIQNDYDILNEYSIDECATLIDSLTYKSCDARLGKEPKADIQIDGDYVKGLASLKSALLRFVEYLDYIKFTKVNTTNNPAIFMGGFDEFKRYVGPKCRNDVNAFCKKDRESHNGICEYCGSKAVLQSAHIKERPAIIQEILDNYYKKGNDYYEVDLNEFLLKFKNAHMPIKDHIFFLCKSCHNKFDKKPQEITVADIIAKRKP